LELEPSVFLPPPEIDNEPDETALTRTAYSSDNMIENMGVVFIIFELLVVLQFTVIFFRVLFFPLFKKFEWLNKKYETFMNTFSRNYWLRFGLEAYLEIAICIYLNLIKK